MFHEIKKNFKKLKPLNFQKLRIPEGLGKLLNRTGILPFHLEKDNFNNFIIRDQE